MTKKEVKFEIKNEYTLENIRIGARDFLEDNKDSNETTFKNYRTSINYFLYLMDCNKHRFATIDNDNKYDALNKFKNCLSNGFTYEVESVDDVLGYTEKTFKPVKRTVKVNANGVNTHLRRITTFFNQCLHLKIKSNEFKKCQVDKPKIKALKIDHVKLLIDECSNCWKKKEIATRNATLIELLFSNALRIREALEITINDTNFIDYNDETNKATLKTNIGEYCITIHQKGRKNKDKSIKIAKPVAEHIINYINIKKVPSDYIFSTTRASTNGKAKALSREWFNKDMNKLASFVDSNHDTHVPRIDEETYNEDVDAYYDYKNICAVVKNNSSHFLRHSRAIYNLKILGMDIRTLQKFLRHSEISSTMIYTDSSDKEVDNINITYVF